MLGIAPGVRLPALLPLFAAGGEAAGGLCAPPVEAGGSLQLSRSLLRP